LLKWIINVPLEKVLLGTEKIARVTHSGPLSRGFGYPASRRRVVLEDGNTALEEVIEVENGKSFRYMVWNFTNSARLATDYALAEFRITENSGGSLLTWTYSFQKKNDLTGFMLRRFVENDFTGYMQVCMNAIKRLSVKENPRF